MEQPTPAQAQQPTTPTTTTTTPAAAAAAATAAAAASAAETRNPLPDFPEPSFYLRTRAQGGRSNHVEALTETRPLRQLIACKLHPLFMASTREGSGSTM